MEHLSTGYSSSEQFPLIHFINTLSSVTSSWLENTQTLTRAHTRSSLPVFLSLLNTYWLLSHTCTQTQTHTLGESCSTSSVLQKLSSFPVSDYHPLGPSLQVYHQLLVLEKNKKKGKNVLLLVPMATALLFSFSAQSIRQRLCSCPAKGERYRDKYHFQTQVWHDDYF